MNKLPKKAHHMFEFLIWLLWIPVILFCSQLIISGRNGTIFHFILVVLLLLFILLSIRWLSKYLEGTTSAATPILARIRKQFLYGFIAPLFALAILASVYDEFINENAIQQIYLIKELSIVIMFLYVANSFYLVIHVDRKLSLSTVKVEEIENYNEKVLVYHQGAYVPINLMEIALIHQLGQINWLVTFEQEEHILDLSLKSIQEILSPKHFFKINRNQIVHKDAIDKFSAGRYGKINVVLKIKELTSTVSKDRAKDFRKWFYK